MQQAGAPAEVIAQWLETQGKKSEVEVLKCNMLPVSVFMRCSPAFVSSGMGAVCIGVAMTEIRAALALLRIPPKQWIELTDDVLLMGRAFAKACRR